MRYPVQIEKIEGEYVGTISHPNGRFQGVCSGESKDEVKQQIVDLVSAVIASAIEEGDEIPSPDTCEKGNTWVSLHPMLSAKLALYNEMRARRMKKATLAKALDVNQKQVDRIFDPRHNSTLPQLEEAANALGKHFELKLA